MRSVHGPLSTDPATGAPGLCHSPKASQARTPIRPPLQPQYQSLQSTRLVSATDLLLDNSPRLTYRSGATVYREPVRQRCTEVICRVAPRVQRMLLYDPEAAPAQMPLRS